MTPLDRAKNKAGSFAKLAELIGAKSASQVHNWKRRGVPIAWCERIERETGIKRQELRPDWYRAV